MGGYYRSEAVYGKGTITQEGLCYFLKKSKSQPRFACVTCSRNKRP
jgi:hypothetical protein